MKKIITLLLTTFFTIALAQATVILDFNDTNFGANFNNIDNSANGPGKTIVSGVTFANVNAEFNKNLYNDTKIYGNNGRLYLEAKSSSKVAGYIEFTVPSAGKVTIEALMGSEPPRNFDLEKKNALGEWENVAVFTINEKGTDASLKRWLPYTHNMTESGECTLRVINAQSGQTQIASITVEAYTGGEEPGDYTSTEILDEPFNSATWEGYTTSGTYDITTSFGKYSLSACSVEPANDLTGNGATSLGRVTLTTKDSYIELPEFSSCGSIKINANSGSESKQFFIQKKENGNWQTLTTFTTHDEKEPTSGGSSVVPAMDYSYEIKSETPVTLRVINATNGAVRLYEIWVTDYVKEDIGTSVEDTTADKGEVISTQLYDMKGVSLNARPRSGIYIERVVYQNGTVETKKLFGTDK